jgi:hypothetical protein
VRCCIERERHATFLFLEVKFMYRFRIVICALLLTCLTCTALEAAKKKLLVLIIASDNHPAFLELQKIWKSYMNLFPEEITAYFIKGDPELQGASEIRENTLYTKTLDSYKPGILKKTILSMQALEPTLGDYDYVLRTNLSSIYDFPKLLEYVKNLPKEKCYAARPLLPTPELPREYAQIPFGWGAGFILSTDLVRLLLQEKEKLYERINDIPDDVLIGALLFEKGVPIIPVPFSHYTTQEEWFAAKDSLSPEVFHFRAKKSYLTRQPEDAYDDELIIATEIVKMIYQIPATVTKNI